MDEPINIPFIAYEASMSRFERINRRLWIAVILLIILLVGSNISWLVYESQFERYEETTVTQENTDGNNNYIGNDGDINNGQADNNNE